MANKQFIKTFLWFDTNLEEALNFYTSVFKNSKVLSKSYYPDDTHFPKGTLLAADFELNGQQFGGLNGGPIFKFTEAISLMINCENQEEVDYYWEKLVEGGGQYSHCGWLKDRFGLSWQVIPKQLGELMTDKNGKKANAVTQAMLKMDKIIVADLQKAYDAA